MVWKYYQWLTLLFVEIYLDRYFGNRDGLLADLNAFVERFNKHWIDYVDIPFYNGDDLNKLCLQNATGSGKTLLMHVNLLQYYHYAGKYGKNKELSRVILLTPNERLSEQHAAEFYLSNIQAFSFSRNFLPLISMSGGMGRVDVLEITKLAEQDGPNTIATRSLGDQNLLLVDEGHRGLSGKGKKEEKSAENAWFQRRSQLCAKGFTFEYSATFEQAVQAAGNTKFENSYGKTILFDYSYRWFYEDGFGKDYQILNLPASFDEVKMVYMTACLLRFYQQLLIYEKKAGEFEPFNLEKPLWVFVGSTVSSGKQTKDEKIVATDVAEIIMFIADFLDNKQAAVQRIHEIITGNGQSTGLLDNDGKDIFAGAFNYLARCLNSDETIDTLYIEEVETLNIFEIEADFMEKFREFLKEEGLPGNERREFIYIPLNVTYDFGKKLKILRPKKKAGDGREYNFKHDAPVPEVGDVPDYLTHNTVVADWYPRIQAIQSRRSNAAIQKEKVSLQEEHLALLDYDTLYFELEQFKRERSWYNLNISKEGIKTLFARNDWYILYLPEDRLNPKSFDGVFLLQQVAAELLRRYCDHYYNYRKREFIEPRLELRELTPNDDNIPREEAYQLIVDGDEQQVIQGIKKIKKELETGKDDLLKEGALEACNFGSHLFQPLFHVRKGGKITVLPVVLNESEYQFVTDLRNWCHDNKVGLNEKGMEIFLLRNLSRGKGVGFFEAANFHPDFILWILVNGRQYVTFIEPHGLMHEGPASEKMLFYQKIKDIEKRLGDPSVILNSFILSWTKYPRLRWEQTKEELEERHVLFMIEDKSSYVDKLFVRLGFEQLNQEEKGLDK